MAGCVGDLTAQETPSGWQRLIKKLFGGVIRHSELPNDSKLHSVATVELKLEATRIVKLFDRFFDRL